MKIKDESQWQAQLAEFAADPDPMAQVFQDFTVTWAEQAEELLVGRVNEDNDVLVRSPIQALRDALHPTEERVVRLTIGHLGMALLVLSTHWAPAGDPQEFYDSLTPIEQNLYADVAMVKLAALQEQAEEEPPLTREELAEALERAGQHD